MSNSIRSLNKIYRKCKNIYRFKKYKQKENTIQVSDSIIGQLKLNIDGKRNHIIIKHVKLNPKARLCINIIGDNNNIEIGNISLGDKLEIKLGLLHQNFGPIHNSKFIIRDNTSIENLEYIAFNSNSNCYIGNDCMISYSVVLYNTDAHAILEYDTNKLVNFVNGINIGNHCWIGRNVTILKNTTIADDCIIGSNSVVSGKLITPHAIYAGNPTKLIKTNRTWNSNGKKYGYIDNDRK